MTSTIQAFSQIVTHLRSRHNEAWSYRLGLLEATLIHDFFHGHAQVCLTSSSDSAVVFAVKCLPVGAPTLLVSVCPSFRCSGMSIESSVLQASQYGAEQADYLDGLQDKIEPAIHELVKVPAPSGWNTET